jgi:hypothetical protein
MATLLTLFPSLFAAISVFPNAACCKVTIMSRRIIWLTGMQSCEQIYFQAQRKSNTKRPDEPHERFLQNHFTKHIENTFSQIIDIFMLQ